MFDQLRKVVAQAVTSDPIYDYKVNDKSAFVCGRHNVFRVRDAVEIGSGKEVSVFQIKFADLVARGNFGTSADMTCLVERVRKGVTLLSQLRHPGILRIDRGLVEVPGKKVWFVTERVKACVPQLELSRIPRQVRVLGMRRCAEAMQFAHETADILLVDFSPGSLFVTSDGRWKIGDFMHAVRRAELAAEEDPVARFLRPPSGNFRCAAAPLLDYLAYECIDAMSGGSQAASLSPSSTTGPLIFPDSDVYSFLLTTVEVLRDGERLFLCGGDLSQHRNQRAEVEKVVSQYFPAGALSRRPRPPMSTVINTGPFATPDMLILNRLEVYDTLDPSERFALLKTLYASLAPAGSGRPHSEPNAIDFGDFSKPGASSGGGAAAARAADGAFCEPVIVENILPLMKRESKQHSLLRFVLPILLQCASALSVTAFEVHLREYFTALLRAMVNAKPPWYEKVGVLAQLVLEKFEPLQTHFPSNDDATQVLVPFLLRCLDTDGGAPDEALIRLALGALSTVFARNSGVTAAVLTTQSATALAAKLTDIGASHPSLFTSSFQCLRKLLEGASHATKEAVELHLVQALRVAANIGGGSGATGYDSNRDLQLQSMISTLQSLEEGFSREHIAMKSIPLLAPLLLSADTAVRGFAVESMERHLAVFRGSGGASNAFHAAAETNAALSSWQAPASNTASSSSLAFSSSSPSAPPRRAPAVSSATTAADVFGEYTPTPAASTRPTANVPHPSGTASTASSPQPAWAPVAVSGSQSLPPPPQAQSFNRSAPAARGNDDILASLGFS